MDVTSAVFWTLLAVLGTLVLLRFSVVMGRFVEVQRTLAKATEVGNEVALEQAREKTLRAEALRAVGKMGGRPREKKKQDDDEEEEEEDPRMEKWERAAIQIGRGLGVDVERALDGDPVEGQKAMQVVNAFVEWAKVQGTNGASAGANVATSVDL